jgi:hypothetical protein
VVYEPKVGRLVGRLRHFFALIIAKKQGAAGITTAAPRIAGQWGRGDNRLPELRTAPKVVPAPDKYF